MMSYLGKVILCLLLLCGFNLADGISSKDLLYEDYNQLGFDPQREFQVYFGDEPKIYNVLEYIDGLENRESNSQVYYSLDILMNNYHGTLRFFKLSMPDDIRARMVNLLTTWVRRYKNPEALKALMFEPELVGQLEPEIRELLTSDSKKKILSAMTPAATRPELFLVDLRRLRYHADDEVALNALLASDEGASQFAEDREELVLRNLFSKRKAYLAVYILQEYEQSALDLLPKIQKRLQQSETTEEQRESVEYALSLIWPNGVSSSL